MRVKMSKQPPPAPTASAVGPCPTAIPVNKSHPSINKIQENIAEHTVLDFKPIENYFASTDW